MQNNNTKKKKTLIKILIILITVMLILLAFVRCSGEKEKSVNIIEWGHISYDEKEYMQKENIEFVLGFLTNENTEGKIENEKVIVEVVDNEKGTVTPIYFLKDLNIDNQSTKKTTTIKDLYQNQLDKDRALLEMKIDISEFLCGIKINVYGMGTVETLQNLNDVIGGTQFNNKNVKDVDKFFNEENENQENKFIKELYKGCLGYYKNHKDEAIENFAFNVHGIFTNNFVKNVKYCAQNLKDKEIKNTIYINNNISHEEIIKMCLDMFYDEI